VPADFPIHAVLVKCRDHLALPCYGLPDLVNSQSRSKFVEFLQSNPVLAGIITLAVLVGIIWSAGLWIDGRARDAVLNDEKFLKTVASQVRPICIFNSNGTVELNQGADEYLDLERLEVKPAPEIYGFNITLHGKRHLNNPPLVSGVDVNLFPEKVERGKGFDWNIVLVPRSTASHIVTEAGMDTKTVYRFKVEIVH
jgi:hypothetical protein